MAVNDSEDFPAQLSGFRPGTLLAGYRLEAQVGAGGMALVFRARDQRLGRLVALKILAPALTADPGFRRRFIAESRAAAVVDDPCIIPVYEAGEASGVLFIAMRFVQGGDLRGVLVREGLLPPGRAAEFISPVASALDAAHRAGLVHRDVKPGNILVDARPDRPDHVYLSDFGVSKGAVSSASLTGTGKFLGTPDYAAPEQIRGLAVDGRTDQYALGCVAYQLLTGTVPFKRDQGMAVLFAHLSEPALSLSARRPGLPGAADQVLARAMAKVPEHRYRSCLDFAEALRAALGVPPYRSGGPAADPPPPVVAQPPFPSWVTAATVDSARYDAGTVPPPTPAATGGRMAVGGLGGDLVGSRPGSHPGRPPSGSAGPPPAGPGSHARDPSAGPSRARRMALAAASAAVVAGALTAVLLAVGHPAAPNSRPPPPPPWRFPRSSQAAGLASGPTVGHPRPSSGPTPTPTFASGRAAWFASGPVETGLSSVDAQDSLFCLSSSSCIADSYYSATAGGAQVAAYNGSRWTITYTDAAHRCPECTGPVLYGIQCLAARLCHALDNQGDFLTYNGTEWTSDFVNSDLYWGSLSCATASFCMAGDAYGNAARSTGSRGRHQT